MDFLPVVAISPKNKNLLRRKAKQACMDREGDGVTEAARQL